MSLRERLRQRDNAYVSEEKARQAADVLDALVALKPRITEWRLWVTERGPESRCDQCHATITDGHSDDCWLRDLLALIDQVER